MGLEVLYPLRPHLEFIISVIFHPDFSPLTGVYLVFKVNVPNVSVLLQCFHFLIGLLTHFHTPVEVPLIVTEMCNTQFKYTLPNPSC